MNICTYSLDLHRSDLYLLCEIISQFAISVTNDMNIMILRILPYLQEGSVVLPHAGIISLYHHFSLLEKLSG